MILFELFLVDRRSRSTTTHYLGEDFVCNNLLVQRPAAIVSPIAGKTRDVVETRLDIGGYPVVIADTAGLRGDDDTADIIEREGVQRALGVANQADLVIRVIDMQQNKMK